MRDQNISSREPNHHFINEHFISDSDRKTQESELY